MSSTLEIENIFNNLLLLSSDKLEIDMEPQNTSQSKPKPKTLNEFLEMLSEERDGLVQSMCTKGLTLEDAVEIVDCLHSGFKYCMEILEFYVLESFSPWQLYQKYEEAKEVLPNWFEGFFSDQKMETECFSPLFIYADADLDSAVEGAVRGAWRFQGKLYWKVTHVYVQESVYDDVVSKLKARCQRLVFGESGDKFCNFIKAPPQNPVQPPGDFEVLIPCPESQHRLLIGWDPKDFEMSPKPNMDLSVVVKPFKTVAEPISIIKSAPYVTTLSIWTLKESIANGFLEIIETGAVWFNCHGIFNPSIHLRPSFIQEFHKVIPAYLAGINFISPYVLRNRRPSGVDNMMKAQTTWSAMSSFQRFRKLREVMKSELKDMSTFDASEIELAMSVFDPSLVTGDPVGLLQVRTWGLGVMEFLWILSALSYGNGVVVWLENGAKDESFGPLIKSLESHGIPRDILKVVVSCDVDVDVVVTFPRSYSNYGPASFLKSAHIRQTMFTSRKSIVRCY